MNAAAFETPVASANAASPTPLPAGCLEYDERPWGNYCVLRDEPHYKLKHITVKPGQRLSLQLHHKREEHWLLINGTADVTVGDEVRRLNKGGYVHIACEQAHRIANVGETPVEFIEVQLGDYFGEDDIVRLQDDYQRA